MPTILNSDIPKPQDSVEFQEMIRDLYKEEWKDPGAAVYGRNGQEQYGVDILGRNKNSGKLEVIQCKARHLTSKMLETEYEKAKGFPMRISRFILATTTSRDTKLQEKAFNLSKDGPYPCTILFWEDIKKLLLDYQPIFNRYYPSFIRFIPVGNSKNAKLVYVDIKETHYELMICTFPSDNKFYKNVILISDLLKGRCQTYQIGGHWERLNNFIGSTCYDAQKISEWLNSFKDKEDFFSNDKERYIHN